MPRGRPARGTMRSTAAIFGAPVTEPPGNVAASSAATHLRPQLTLDGRDEVLDAGERRRNHEFRPVHAARLADPRQVVPLEVDDHHVLGRVLGRREQLGAPAARHRPLDRPRPHTAPAPCQEELG